MVTAGRLLLSVSARFYATCGWLSFRLGLRKLAQRHYERVLRLVGDDFSAYIHLGRMAYDAGDYAGWRREFEHARRANPNKFARLRHRFELFEPRLAGTTFDDTGERATWRSLRPFGTTSDIGGLERRRHGIGDHGNGGHVTGSKKVGGQFGNRPVGDSTDNSAYEGGLDALPAAFDVPATDPSDDPASEAAFLRASNLDDCASDQERQRFCDLGSIARDEFEACDLDELGQKLTEGD